MKAILELEIEGTPSTSELRQLGKRVLAAITGDTGPKVKPRLLVELGPNYLEVSLVDEFRPSKHHSD